MTDHAPGDATPLTVLAVLEHDPAGEIVHRLLVEEGLRVVRQPVSHLADAWSAAPGAHAVLLDDRADPAELRQALDRGVVDSTAPVFVVTRRLPEPGRYTAWLEAGAWDIVKIPLESTALILRLRNILRARRTPEPVHGWPTVRYSRDTLERVADETLALARRRHHPVHCLALRLEGCNPAAGDPAALLERLAEVSRSLLRASDVIGLGDHGPLFILLPQADGEAAAASAARIRSALASRLRDWGVSGTLVAASVGSSHVATGEDLLDAALRALG